MRGVWGLLLPHPRARHATACLTKLCSCSRWQLALADFGPAA
jgi:hypothetical protein